MIIHAACPSLVAVRKPGNRWYQVGDNVDVNSAVNSSHKNERSWVVMVLPFDDRQSDNNVLLSPPPLLHADPFPLDDILDVSAKRNKRQFSNYFNLIYFRLFC